MNNPPKRCPCGRPAATLPAPGEPTSKTRQDAAKAGKCAECYEIDFVVHAAIAKLREEQAKQERYTP